MLAAIDDPAAVARLGPGADRRRIGTGFGFAEGERAAELPLRIGAQVFFLLRGGAQALHRQADTVGQPEVQGGPEARELLQHGAELREAQSLAAPFLRDAQAGITLLADQFQQFRRHGAGGFGCGQQGCDRTVDEFARCGAQVGGVVVKVAAGIAHDMHLSN